MIAAGRLAPGTKVYSAYVSTVTGAENSWIDEGVVTDIVVDGVALVRIGNHLSPLDQRWHQHRHEAQRDIHLALVRRIGTLQAKADEIAAEILHADLTTEAA